jgi:hypothetical protein
MNAQAVMEVAEKVAASMSSETVDKVELSRVREGVEGASNLGSNLVKLAEPHKDFLYLLVPLLPFGHSSRIFKVGTMGSSVRLVIIVFF